MYAELPTLSFLLIVAATLVSCEPRELGEDAHAHMRTKRQAVTDRNGCKSGATAPATRVDSTQRLAALRALYTTVLGGTIHAYIIPTEDAHQSEYPSAYDERRGYISGFSGSAGTAVVLSDAAALWTDGRYFLEAEDSLDCNWILMRQGVPGVPSITDWLLDRLRTTTNARIGANPFLMNAKTWKTYEEIFSKEGITMVAIDNDFVDRIWTTGRPSQPNTPINELTVEYAGKTWQSKIGDVRARLNEKGAAAYIVTSLDETAWLFNLRASDISYNPFFISYAIVEQNRVRLYLLNHNTKLTQNPTDSASVKKLHVHLNTGMDGTCSGTALCVQVLAYSANTVKNDLASLASANNANKLWISFLCNYALYSVIPENQRIHAQSAISLMKSKKNLIERSGMQEAHIRDAVALITFLEVLEKEVKAGTYWSETKAALELKKHRLAQDRNRGLSFPTIAGSGANGAIIHYRPTNATDKQITTTDMFLLDSGGQYLDGTTDVTRTFHFGSPSDYEKECYTRVLMGHIDLALLKWPKGLYGRQIDAIARAPLWNVGLRYLHGTGHGIGAYLSVHEGPGRISLTHAVKDSDQAVEEHMYFSDEPGYYEEGKFGIRLETIVTIEVASTKYSFPNTVFLGFKPVTLVPYEPNLIKFDMLSPVQKQWLSDYNDRIVEEVVPRLGEKAKQWVTSRIDQFAAYTSGSTTLTSGSTLCLLLLASLALLNY